MTGLGVSNFSVFVTTKNNSYTLKNDQVRISKQSRAIAGRAFIPLSQTSLRLRIYRESLNDLHFVSADLQIA